MGEFPARKGSRMTSAWRQPISAIIAVTVTVTVAAIGIPRGRVPGRRGGGDGQHRRDQRDGIGVPGQPRGLASRGGASPSARNFPFERGVHPGRVRGGAARDERSGRRFGRAARCPTGPASRLRSSRDLGDCAQSFDCIADSHRSTRPRAPRLRSRPQRTLGGDESGQADMNRPGERIPALVQRQSRMTLQVGQRGEWPTSRQTGGG